MRFVGRVCISVSIGMAGALLIAAQAPAPAPAPVPAAPPAPAPASTPAPAPHSSLAALGLLDAGLWQLDAAGRPPKLVCLTDGSEMIQVVHDQPGCSRFVIANEAKSATVHYSCQAAGWGRTTIRVETSQLAAVRTQGIAHNAPFDLTLTARRVGAACGASPAR